MKGRVIILGLDGATFDVIEPLCNKGYLPNLNHLIKNGAYGSLESTFPPVTAAAWMSIATGKNPGKTGVFTFRNRKDDSLNLYSMSSNDYRKNVSFWDILSSNNYKIGILNYPGLYPPYKIKGFMHGGVGTPEKNVSFPDKFEDELNQLVGEYKVSLPINSPRYDKDKESFIRDIRTMIKGKKKVIEYILSNYGCDLYFLVLPESDFIQHVLWEYRTKSEFIELWKEIDKIVGQILHYINKNDTLLIISDHGFGSLKNAFRINQWLVNEGYLTLKKEADLKSNFLEKLLKNHYFYDVVMNIKKKLPIFVKSKVHLKTPIIDKIDFQKSYAVALEYSVVGGIEILNRKSKSFEKLRDEIIFKLKEFVDDNNNGLENIEIYKKEEIYQGTKIENLPDIVFLLDNSGTDILVNDFGEKLLIDKSNMNNNRSGSHRKHGVFIAYGNEISQGEVKDLKLYDMAPTILYLFGIRAPADIDGKMPFDLFKNRKNATLNYYKNNSDKEENKISDIDEKIIKDKLKDLGYLE